MSNKLLLTSDYNFKSGYGTLLSTILEQCLKNKIAVIPKFYDKPDKRYEKYFNLPYVRDGSEKELLIYSGFVYPSTYHPLLHLQNGKNKTLLTMWEATKAGDLFIDKINIFDQIIVPNKWNKQNFLNQGCTSEIKVLNFGIDNDLFTYTKPLNTDVFTFGTGNNDVRKRANEVIKCFLKAFPYEKDVRLSIKSCPSTNIKALSERISFIPAFLNGKELKKWYCSNDVFVSGVSAEGWGYMQHESMACGRPIIASNYAGLNEFMTEENSFCLKFTEEDATDFWEYPGSKWSKFDEDHMIETMRYCYNNRDKVIEKGKLASLDVLRFSQESFIENLLGHLKIFKPV